MIIAPPCGRLAAGVLATLLLASITACGSPPPISLRSSAASILVGGQQYGISTICIGSDEKGWRQGPVIVTKLQADGKWEGVSCDFPIPASGPIFMHAGVVVASGTIYLSSPEGPVKLATVAQEMRADASTEAIQAEVRAALERKPE